MDWYRASGAMVMASVLGMGTVAVAQDSPAASATATAPRACGPPGYFSDPDEVVDRTIPLIGADVLLGKTVHDRRGDYVGSVGHLMLDSEEGCLQYIVLDRSWPFEDEALMVIPWAEIEATPWQDRIDLRVRRTDLDQAPRVSEENLEQMLDQAAVTAVHEFWMALSPDARGASDPPPTRPQVLVSQGQIRTLTPAAVTLAATGIAESEVLTREGEPFGQIDELVIDLDAGRIAYVLIERGGFLGLGAEWYPVPFDQVDWSGDETFRLLVNDSIVEARETFTSARVPRSVRREQLAKLYRDFDSTPYWQELPRE